MKSWHTSTLIKRALSRSNESDSYWNCVHELRRRPSQETFDAAVSLTKANTNAKKALGADILAQLGTPAKPFYEPSLTALWSLLKSPKSPMVLYSVLTAIGHLQKETDSRRIKDVTTLSSHPSDEVRMGVVHALLGRRDERSIKTLVRLSADKKSDIRDWATFGLGTLIDVDTPIVRKALERRLADPDLDTRSEALMGLASRKAPSCKEHLIHELKSAEPTSLVFDSAAALGDPALLPLVQTHYTDIDRDTDSGWLASLDEACKALSNEVQD